MRLFILCTTAVLLFGEALAQSPAHVAAVRQAQKSAYAISEATNGCPTITTDLLGWPAAVVRKCIYVVGPTGNKRTGIAYLLDIGPETIARWIETSCGSLLPRSATCFNTVLKCGRNNSGMMFAVSGNILENMDHATWENYFFRNGMTVRIGGEPNGTTVQVDPNRQEALATLQDDAIVSIPSGLTRYWRTLPRQFAARFPTAGAPTILSNKIARQKWLDLVKVEILEAINGSENRLLDAWIAGHLRTIRNGNCPTDGDP